MKKLLFLLLVITCHQLSAQSLKLSQATINDFSKAMQAKYKASPVFKENIDRMQEARYPESKPLPLLRTMKKDTKVLDDVMVVVARTEVGEQDRTTAYFRELKFSPAKAKELADYCVYVIVERSKQRTESGDEERTTFAVVEPAVAGEEDIFTVVEQPPTFKGGNDSLMRYLESHIKYPQEAFKKKISGKVFVMFVINKTGKIEQVKTISSAKGGGLEEEAMRVISAMPDWNPGKQNNKFVLVQYTLPVKFTLPKE